MGLQVDSDSTGCQLSADNISVLAGQNESGKTAILQALRDFDLDDGETPRTSDYTPDGRLDAANPRVAVKFSISAATLDRILKEEAITIPTDVRTKILGDGFIWVIRDLPSGTFDVSHDLGGLWSGAETLATESQTSSEATAVQSEASTETKAVSSSAFASALRLYWPLFVYFDAFEDTLPRTVDVSALQAAANGAKKKTRTASPGSTIPSAVEDYIVLAGLDLEVIAKFATVKRCGQSVRRDSEANHCAACANLANISSEIANFRGDEHTPSSRRAD